MTEYIDGIPIYRPKLTTEAEAKRVTKLCANVEQSYKGYNTTRGFILTADYLRARAIFDGLDAAPAGRRTTHDWDLVKVLVLEVAAMPEFNTQVSIRHETIRLYAQKHALKLSDSATFQTKVRDWLKK